jgi:hypothetical protein
VSFKPFYINAFEQESGESQYYEPFLIPDKAFQKLEDAICWRGKILKRPGNKLLGRLRRELVKVTLTNQANGASYDVADVLDDTAIDVRDPAAGTTKEPYAEIEPGTVIITVGAITLTDPGKDGVLVGVPATHSGTINYVTGALHLAFNPALGIATNVTITFFYYPALPVMGLQRREASTVNNEQPIAFDTKYAYTIFGLKFIELPSAAATTWRGYDWNLFWAWNYYVNASGRMYWVTNNNTGAFPDPIRYYDGTTWTTFNPAITAAGSKLQQCKVLVSYKDRLIAMNTWEGAALPGTNYQNRVRWSVNGDPTGATAWRDDIIGQGGYKAAPTNEAIVSASFIRDTLLIKFERSSWKLIYTGNKNDPFYFQKINTDLGCESTFSLVSFDKGVLAIGDKGITMDDSVNVSRIDKNVPNAVFNIRNDENGDERVYGTRDFVSELTYWSYPDGTTSGVVPTFPNKVLVYNYINETWAKFNDSYTCYGDFQKLQTLTWADYSDVDHDFWSNLGFAWGAGVSDALFPDKIGGNQQGFVSIITPATSPGSSNDTTLSITKIDGTRNPCRITVPNHNLQSNQFIKIVGVIGDGGVSATNPEALNNVPIAHAGSNLIYKVFRISAHEVDLYKLVSGSFVTVDIGSAAYTGTYIGGGEIVVLNSFNIITKEFSPFYEQGSQCRLGYVDFFITRTESGQFTADLLVDSCPFFSMNKNTPSLLGATTLTGTNVVSTAPENLTLAPYQEFQSKIWHRTFTHTISQNFTLKLTLSDEQMANSTIDASRFPFAMHSIAFYLSPNARLVQ